MSCPTNEDKFPREGITKTRGLEVYRFPLLLLESFIYIHMTFYMSAPANLPRYQWLTLEILKTEHTLCFETLGEGGQEIPSSNAFSRPLLYRSTDLAGVSCLAQVGLTAFVKRMQWFSRHSMKADVEPLSGPRRFGYARWGSDKEKPLVSLRRIVEPGVPLSETWSAQLVMPSHRPGWIPPPVLVQVRSRTVKRERMRSSNAYNKPLDICVHRTMPRALCIIFKYQCVLNMRSVGD